MEDNFDISEYLDQKIIDTEVANRFKYFRETYIKLSQNKAAKATRLTQPDFGYIETAKRAPTFRIINVLTEIYDLNQTWLITGKGDPQIGKTNKTLGQRTIDVHVQLAEHKARIELLELKYAKLLSTIKEVKS